MNKKSLFAVSFVILMVTLCLTTGCDMAAKGGNLVGGTELNPIKDYGNGVYYIASREDVFGSQLSSFKKDMESKGKRIVCISGSDTGGYGSTNGYFVVVEDVEKKKTSNED